MAAPRHSRAAQTGGAFSRRAPRRPLQGRARLTPTPPAAPPPALSADHTPFLHKLLLLRDTLREDFGLPGGLHETARPDAYEEADEDVRALFTYRTGASPSSGTDLVPVPPLVVAAQRGNADAVHLLMLFGEGVHARRRSNERALQAAAEQGNALVVAALLGRVPLRPPRHPPHVAKRLGLLRPTYRVYGPGFTYAAGVLQGPFSVPAAIAGAKIRAEVASAQGIATAAGTRASASAAAALTGTAQGAIPGAAAAAANSSLVGMKGGPPGKGAPSISNAAMGMNISTVEAVLSQTEALEADGRYRCVGRRGRRRGGGRRGVHATPRRR